ncbi:MAG: hypothetical protein ACPG49_09750, partial [Chitinophagales bacterium]
PCDNVACVNGECLVSATGDPFCNCDEGFSGPTCEEVVDPCESLTCVNGECVVGVDGNVSCNCEEGFSGPNCDISISDCTLDCGANGTCVLDANGLESCECDLGYTGVNCEIFDVCSGVQCPENATCVEFNGEVFCECNFGYEGDNCEIEIRNKFLGTYTGKVDYTDGDVFNDFTENVTVTADPNDVEQFFINSFEDFSIPASERFSFTAKVVPIDQKAHTFQIVGNHTSNYVLDGNQYRVIYSGAGLGTRSETTGRIVIEYKVEDINPSTGEVLATLSNILTLIPQ